MQENFDSCGLFNQSAVKTMNIIELLAQNGSPLRLNDIAKDLEMNSSTVLRFLTALKHSGYVEQNPETLKYYLTLKLNSIVSRIDPISYLRETAHPYLCELATYFKSCLCLGVEQDMKIVYIDIVNGAKGFVRSEARIGNSTSMHCTGIGKLLMLNYNEEEILHWEKHMGFTIYSKNTIRTHDELMACLAEARKNDYAFDNEECEIGAYCVAVPVRDFTGKIIAGISVSGMISELSCKMTPENIQLLSETVAQISRGMGYKK